MKYSIFLFVLYFGTVNAQDRTVSKVKFQKNGYLLAYIQYKDSNQFSKNKIVYCFFEEGASNDESLDKLFKNFNANTNHKHYSFIKTEFPYKSLKSENYGIFRNYGILYSQLLAQDHSKQYDSTFILDIEKTFYRILYDSLNEIKQLFIAPYLSNNKIYANFYSMVKVRVSYYVLSYNRFKDYEDDFINTSNDNKSKNLVGLVSTFAKLKRIQPHRKKYRVILPIEIQEIE